MDERRRLRRDIGWNLVPVALLAVVGLGLNLLIGGWWGAAALGSFNLVTIALFTFAILGAMGVQFAVLRAIAEDPDDRDRVEAIVVGALVPCLVIAAVTTAVFVALAGPIGAWMGSEAVGEGMRWAAPGLFCFAVNKVLLAVVNGLRRMRAFAIYTSIRYLLIGVGLVIARGWELEADQLPVIWSFTEGTLLLVLIGELVATVSISRGLARRAENWVVWARRHLAFGARSVLASLSFEINSKLDVWMLGIALPDTYVGIYSLASAIYEGATQLAIVLQNNVNPVIARSIAAGKHAEVDQLVQQTRRWFVPALFGVAALGAALYPFIIPWMVGEASFVAGAAPFAILMLGMALASPVLPFNQMLVMAALPGWHTIYMLCVLTVSLIANLVLIPVLGLEGAAVSTATAMVASALLLRAMVRSRVGVRL